MPSIGDLLAERYRLDDLIGSGGFASVFRAHDLRLDRDVAVKVLLANGAADPVIAARFDREARVLAAVSHPNVVAIHDVEPGDPASGAGPFLVMDLCDGGSLADRLAAAPAGRLAPDELVPILVDVASGLDALHAQGIVHRDLKPSNVLLSDGRARIADLGIAAVGPSELTAVGTTVGTLAYLAPEQLAGDAGSPASDVHALGVIAFLALTGRLPRPADSVTDVVAASLRPVEPPSAVAPELGPAFDAPIESALVAEPAYRPTATELAAGLTAALGRRGGGEVPAILAMPHTAPMATAAAEAPTEAALALPAVAAAAGVRQPPEPSPPASRPRSERDRPTAAVVGTLLAGVVVVVLLVLLLGRGGSAGPSPSTAGGVGAGASATPRASSTSAPAATTDRYADAVAASQAMRSAVGSASSSKTLDDGKAKDIDNHLDKVDQALDRRDAQTARAEAKMVAMRVDDLGKKKGADPAMVRKLTSAADRLVAATNALPE